MAASMQRIEIVSDRRRAHDPAFRARVVVESYAPGTQVRELADRHGICTSLVYRWRRERVVVAGTGSALRLVPVRLVEEQPAAKKQHEPWSAPTPTPRAAAKPASMEIEFPAACVCASTRRSARRPCGGWSLCCADDPGPVWRSGVAGRRCQRHAPRHERLGAAGSAGAGARSPCWRPLCVQGLAWGSGEDPLHDDLGMSLYAKRLERGRFVWPQAQDGAVSLTPAMLSMLLDGIDWRHPQRTWRPEAAG